MHFRMVVLALAGAAFLLATFVAAVSARILSTSEADFAFTWSELTLATAEGALPVSCQVTLDGSFHSTSIAKINGALVGLITHASISSCSGGTATLLQGTLPWHVTYEAFLGELPSVDAIRFAITGMSIGVQATGGSVCLATTTPSEPLRVSFDNKAGLVETVTSDERALIDLNDLGGIFCDLVDGTARGAGAVTTSELDELFMVLLEAAPGVLGIADNPTSIPFGDRDESIRLSNVARRGANTVFVIANGFEQDVPTDIDKVDDGCRSRFLPANESIICQVRISFDGEEGRRAESGVYNVIYTNGTFGFKERQIDVIAAGP